MSAAFKCDRCGGFCEDWPHRRLEDIKLMHCVNGSDREPTYHTARSRELCKACSGEFEAFMRREPTSVLQPKQQPTAAEQNFMQAVQNKAADEWRETLGTKRPTDCPRCWQYGINITHGLMEVCPNRQR